VPRRVARPLGPPLATGLFVTAVMAAVCLYAPSFVTFLELKAYDSFLRFAPHRAPTGAVAVVDLDEPSLARFGQWPWPRYRVARLLSRIRDAGAQAVAIDMVFAEADRTSIDLLAREIRRDFGVAPVLGNVPPEAVDGDRTLARALEAGPFVLGYPFDFEGASGDDRFLQPLGIATRSRGGEVARGLHDAPGVVPNLPVLARAAGASGFFNVVADRDGVLRRVPMLIRHRGKLYPALALAAVLRARGGDPLLLDGPGGSFSLRLGGRDFPLDRKGNLLVNFRGPRRTFPHVSAGAILDGTADPGALRGKIVVVGTTAAGLQEIRTTPLEAAHPGPEIQATVVDNLLAGDALASPGCSTTRPSTCCSGWRRCTTSARWASATPSCSRRSG
jgi:adenylate cyclase